MIWVARAAASRRPGFERLLAAICEGRVGAVLAIEASRLARNGRDWHTLIEFCGLVGTIIVDEDGIYDPRHPNDRLLLGMKGTMSELELSLFRQRSQEALKQKARRGALFLGVAAGYVKTGRDRIEKDPDQRVQNALQARLLEVRRAPECAPGACLAREEGIELPAKSHDADGRAHRLEAAALQHRAQHSDQPRLCRRLCVRAHDEQDRSSRTAASACGADCGVRMAEWDVLLKDQHEGYIAWAEFERNQRVIADNATGKGSAIARGAARRGELILAGLLGAATAAARCTWAIGKSGRYYCQGANVNHGTERCISFGSFRADEAVGAEVMRVLKPLGIDAAVKALEAQASETSAARGSWSWRCSRRATRPRMRAGNTTPSIRPIVWSPASWSGAGTRRSQAVHRIEREIAELDAKRPPPLGEKERQHLMQLGADLERAWSHPAASAATRKRILRAALKEIIARVEGGFIEMVLHWQGGDHTALKLKMNTAGKHRWTVPEDTLTLVRELARQMPDKQIARLLNRAGKPTGRGNGWTEVRVRSFRDYHEIMVYRPGEWAERGEITLEAAANIIGVTPMTALRMIRRGDFKGRQLCRGAPWVIKAEDVAAFAGAKTRSTANSKSCAAAPLTFNDVERCSV